MRILFLVFCTIGLFGCASPETADMAAVSQCWKVIGPEYLTYTQADPALSPEQKASRKDTVTLLDKVVAGYNARK